MSNVTQNKSEATVESFWSMLNKEKDVASIYIPRIQRDYAQGRTDATTTQIREKFVDDIFDCIVDNAEDGKVLDINFIYGNIEDYDGYKRFVPIDGQQRLTTLFLLHWYFAVFSGKIDSDPEVKKSLLRFQYETRNVTGKFCENLTEYVRVDFKAFPKDKKVSDAIRDYYWFFSDFDNDSSVKSMLVMIDAIHEKSKEYLDAGTSLDDVFDLLISDHAPIRFLYQNIDDIGLTDSIYIKMNARGKALTHFENFKAQLYNYLSDDQHFSTEFIDNINGCWSEFFWTSTYRRMVKDPSTGKEILETNFDSQMMKFFRFAMLMDYIVNVDDSVVVNSQKVVRDSLRNLLKEPDYFFTSRLFKDEFRHVYGIKLDKPVLSVNTFKKMSILLNVLSNRQKQTGSIVFTIRDEFNKTYLDETDAFCRLIGTSDKRFLTNEEQIILYAEYAFLIKYANPDFTFDKEVELTRWLRLISNLVKPTLNLQLDIFFGMIRSVHRLVENGSAMDCNKYMSRLLRRNYRQSVMSVFTETQVIEESIKSILMQIDPMWKTVIAESERTFMEGQTGAIFQFSGLTEEYNRQIDEFQDNNPGVEALPNDVQFLVGIDNTSTYYRSFSDYLNKFKMLFDENGVKEEIEDKALFRRALLCYGKNDSYMLPPGKARQSFLDNTDRDFGFRRLLRDDNNGKRTILKELMDDIVSDQPITDQLQKIIDEKTTFDGEERWKKYFIKIPEILESLYANGENVKDPQGEWVFMSSQRFVRKNNADDILLLTRTQTNSINRELYSYVLFLKAQEKNLPVYYHADYTDSAEKYAYFDNNQGKRVHVVYRKRDDDSGYFYIAKNSDDTEIIYYDTLDGMLDYVEKTVKHVNNN